MVRVLENGVLMNIFVPVRNYLTRELKKLTCNPHHIVRYQMKEDEMNGLYGMYREMRNTGL